MSRQDKATTDRNARLLRELVKQPDNKSCADCRRNDARWASWNLGVFVCIRCSGIHRSMGTHISRVKSVDLDIWTPEQMESMQIWGNKLANLYWEKHLKPGHVPPEHKIESFIRSKYESKRWAMSGPRPDNPKDLLEEGGGEDESAPAVAPAPPPAQPRSSSQQQQQPQPKALPTPRQQQPVAHPLLSTSIRSAAPPPQPIVSTPSLFGSPIASSAATSAPPPAPAPSAPSSSIFDLDFHSPSPPAVAAPRASAKNDIMSLFGAPPPPAPAPQPWGGNSYGASSGGGGVARLTSGMGSMGFGGGGGTSSGADVWGSSAPVQQQQAPVRQQQQQQPVQQNLWDATPSQNVWSTPAPTSPPATNNSAPKQLDAFADIWK